MSQQKEKILIYIHGGEPFNTYEAYLEDLKNYEYDPFKPNTKRWTDTLASLENKYQIIKILMPCKQNAKYREWEIMFEKIFPYLNPNQEITFVGWSLGAIFLMKYFCKNNLKEAVKLKNLNIKIFHLLGTPFDDCGDFNMSEKLLKNLSMNPEKLNFYHSKDDFVVNFDNFKKYKSSLPNAHFIEFEDKNHFLQETFPELLEELKK